MIPVVPTAHYTMGGIPTNVQSQVLRVTDGVETPVPGLMAIGEAACNSCHGANRLGCNSLLDLVVFGRDAGDWAAKNLTPDDADDETPESFERALTHLDRVRFAEGEHTPRALRRRVQQVMSQHAPVFRDGKTLHAGDDALAGLADASLKLCNHEHPWNIELVGALETENLLAQAQATMRAALLRTESRGAHFREDFPARDDAHWLNHSLIWREGLELTHANRAVHLTSAPDAPSFAPEVRNY
jgi:succinate dehydrogenase / fumarate reductase flavoprotein subunit